MAKKLYHKLIVILILIGALFFLGNIQQVYAQTNLIGDFNKDERKDVSDLLILLRHISSSRDQTIQEKYPDWYQKDREEDLDINKDGKVDITDCLILQRHIAADKNPTIAFREPEWIIKDTVPETLKLNMDKATINLENDNKELQLIPYNAETGEEFFTGLIWESSDSQIATVNGTGKVTGVGEGTCVITARVQNGTEVTCEVTVVQEETKITPESILLNKSNLELELKQIKSIKLEYRITPSNANADTQVEWISSDPKIVEVDAKGKVTPKAEGNAIITVKTANEKTATCNVLVKNTNEVTDIYPEGLSNETPKIKIILNENAYSQMKTQIVPSNANVATTITYSSSDTSIVQVDAAGNLRGIKEGSCTITATTENGKTTKSTVTVENGAIIPQSIKINEPEPVTLTVGEKVQLTTTITPNNANVDTALKWESNNQTVASVDSNGFIIANKQGSCTISVTTENGKTAQITVNVEDLKIQPEGVEITVEGGKNLQNMKINEVAECKAIITPSNANTDTQITWTSSNEKIAVVDGQGMVQAKAAGQCIITATTGNGKKASYTIKVVNLSEPAEVLPVNVEITATSSSDLSNIKVEDTIQMSATVTPSNATNKKVTWTSSNEKVAVVNEQGMVRIRAIGNVTITATTHNGKSASYQIKVTAPSTPKEILPTHITVLAIGNGNFQNMNINETIQMSASIVPNNATNKKVNWTSSNDNVAIVNEQGMVRTRAAGECTITGTTHNGLSDSYTIRVVAAEPEKIVPSSVSINTGGQTTLEEKKTKQLSAVILPSNANTDTRIEWKSSDPRIATVNSNGLVTAIKAGTCTISVTTANGKTNNCTITVKQSMIVPTSVSIKAEGATELKVNNTVKLNATISPSNANTSTNIVWVSTNNNVAVVNNQGLVQAKGAGTCTIIATTGNGKSSSCTITVASDVQDRVAPKIQIKASYEGYIMTGGTTATYQISITEENLKSFDKTKIKLTGDLKDEATYQVTGSGKTYTAKVTIPNKSGRLGIAVESGAAIDQANNKSTTVQYHNMDDYVFTLNETTADQRITATVGVVNSFYIKDYEFYLNDTSKIKGRTTNEYTYTGLTTGSTYKIKVKVNIYKDKKTNDTVTGWVEKSIKVQKNDGVEVHFINVTEGTYAGDCIFIKTKTGKTIMIDTGPSQTSDETTGKILRKNQTATIDKYLRKDKKLVTASGGIVKVDYLVITHSHLDHIGGFRILAGIHYNESAPGYTVSPHKINGDKIRYEFGKIILGCNAQAYKEDEAVASDSGKRNKAIYCYANRNNKLIRVTAGNALKIDNIVLNIFNPYNVADVPKKWVGSNEVRNKPATIAKTGTNETTTSMQEANGQSIVIKLICGSRKMLLTGDAEFYTEEILLGIPAKQVANNDKTQAGGLAISSSAGGKNNDKPNLSGSAASRISLVYDLITNKYDTTCTTLAKLEEKYKLSRLTAKDIDAQVLKKGHHGYHQSTSISFLKAVKPNKIVSTGVVRSGGTSTITCVDNGADYRIRRYYNQDGNGTPNGGNAVKLTDSNWKKYVFGTVTHGSFYIFTENGTAWDNSDAYAKVK